MQDSAAALLARLENPIAGKYERKETLGVGGMAVVVAARHLQLGEDVAVKLILPEVMLDPGWLVRVQREARASARIKSEHVVRVIDVDVLASGTPFIVMERLEGKNLQEVLDDRGRLSMSDAIDYVLQACEAVAEAHARGIVHRDLKPSNLFLTERADGSPLVKVLDFGISKELLPADPGGATPHMPGALTDTRSVLGSPMYMSPEQIRSAKHVDARTDIWALGVILHQLVVGKPPFIADAVPGLLAAIIADPPVPLRRVRPDAPVELENAITACLKKDPAERLQSVADFARLLAPIAPPRARLSIERIVGMSARSLPSLPSLPSSSPSVPSAPSQPAGIGLVSTLRDPETVGGPMTTRRKLAVAAVALAIAGGIGLVGLHRPAGTERAPAAGAPSGIAATAIASSPSTSTSAAATTTASASATLTATASATASATAAAAPKASAKAARRSPPRTQESPESESH